MILTHQLVSEQLGHMLRLLIIICICLIIHIFGFRHSYLHRDFHFLRLRNLCCHNMRSVLRLRFLRFRLFLCLFFFRLFSLLHRGFQLMCIRIAAFFFNADLALLKVFPCCRCEDLPLRNHIHLRLTASKFIAKEIFRDCSHVLSLLP